MGSIPSYQEMIDYGDGAGLENEGTVYCILIVDTAASTEENENVIMQSLRMKQWKS